MRGTYPVAVPRMGRRLSHVDIGGISDLTVWLESTWGVERDSSGNISKVNDRSGRGNHAVQATSAARPTYGNDAAGRRAIGTTIAARFLSIPSAVDLDPHATKGFTAYFVYSTTNAAVNCFPLGRWHGASVVAHNWLLGVNNGSTSASGWYISETGTNSDRVSVMGDGSTGAVRITAGRYDPSGFSRASLGNVAGTSTAIAGVKAGSTEVTIGRFIPTDASLGMDGNFYALLIVRRYIPFGSVDDVMIRDYLRQQHGAS